jgi:anti-sigma regulatory factor (Ser/Thr protein kinase)
MSSTQSQNTVVCRTTGGSATAMAKLARLAGPPLRNAQRYEAEQRTASTRQRSLRPRSIREVPGTVEVTQLGRFTMILPADPTRLTVLRQRLEKFLSAHRVSDIDIFDLIIAVSEATANAIEHPLNRRTDVVEVEVSIDHGAAVATVRDSGQWRPATAGGNRGRGLALIGELAELSVRRTPDGTAVTFRRRLTR